MQYYITRRLCVLSNTKLYHQNLLLWISTKFWIAVQSNIKPNCQPRWLSGLRRTGSLVHSLMITRHCVLRNWDRIPVMAVKGLNSLAGIVSICPLLWQTGIKLPTNQFTWKIDQRWNYVKLLFARIWFIYPYLAPKYHFCPYLALLTCIYHYVPIFGCI